MTLPLASELHFEDVLCAQYGLGDAVLRVIQRDLESPPNYNDDNDDDDDTWMMMMVMMVMMAIMVDGTYQA